MDQWIHFFYLFLHILLSNKSRPWKEERSEHSSRKSQKCPFAKANSIYQTSNFLFQAWFHGFVPPAKSSRTSNLVMSTHGKLWIPCWQRKVSWWTSGKVNSSWTPRNSVVLRNSLWFWLNKHHFLQGCFRSSCLGCLGSTHRPNHWELMIIIDC